MAENSGWEEMDRKEERPHGKGRFYRWGSVATDLLVATLILVVSIVLLPVFPAMFAAFEVYLHKSSIDRKLKDPFIFIKDNWSILLRFTILMLVMWVFPILTLFFVPTTAPMYVVVSALAWIILVFSIIILVAAPVIIDKMNVNLRQLVANSFLFIFGSPLYSFLSIALAVVFVVLSVVISPLFGFAVGFVCWGSGALSYLSFNKILNRRHVYDSSSRKDKRKK